ncbi:TIGR01777 family oxidoreductase [Pleurocapsa sp. PCC 7319]|uniref:thylakoid membrane protein ThyD n=1 Tax=Pleurocapsa sp. PCC 7319 TaxID=118161 RepID=UPI000348FB96|nr:TIGR01777 family oxidoreductase [Pleurocapsa sp. PCC 7319]
MKIAITGATGLVGSRLVEKLNQEGHQILVFTRNPNKAQKVFPASAFSNLEIVQYTPKESGEWQKSVSGCDAVVNLAGEPIAERWNDQQKQAIMESRQIGTRKLVEAIAMAEQKPQVLVSGSAVGYYGTSETTTFEENSPSGNDFLAQVCQNWEAEAQKVTESGVRLVIVRIGIVLANGGALGKMIGPFKMFAGGPIGSGKQWFSWIHRDDLVNLIYQAIERSDMSGAYNATSPNPVRMGQLCQTLGEVMNRPSWLPVPDFVLEILLGDGAVVVLEGQQVLPQKTQATGFNYQYAELKPALSEIVT